jgi:hypothetical protein
MRHVFPREFYIPKQATTLVDAEGTDAHILTYETAGVPYAIGFYGKAAKPAFHHRFRNEASRAQHIAGFISGRKQRADYMAKRREERKQPHPLKEGSILHTSWGYDQTNVEWFQVTRVVSERTVELREIAAEITETGWCTGNCKPIPGAFVEPRYEGDDRGVPIVRRANPDGSVKIDDVRRAWIGSSELRWSSYA